MTENGNENEKGKKEPQHALPDSIFRIQELLQSWRANLIVRLMNIKNICLYWYPETAELVLKAAEAEIARIQGEKHKAETNFREGEKYRQRKKLDLAIIEFGKALNTYKGIYDIKGQAGALEMLARSWFAVGQKHSASPERYNNSIKATQEALELYQKSGDCEGAERINVLITEIENKKQEENKAGE